MRSVGIRELKSQASKIVRSVQETGETVSVTVRGKEVARIVPALARSRAQELEEWHRGVEKLRRELAAVWPEGVSAVEAVREQRRDL